MTDAENTVDSQEVAPQAEDAQSEQVATTEQQDVAAAPETVSDTEQEAPRKYAGKYDSVEDLESSYEELQSKFTKNRQAQQSPVTEQKPVRTAQANPFDEETTRGVSNIVERALLNKEAQDFERKNSKVLEDPILHGTVARLMQQARESGNYLNQEVALSQAQSMLDERLKPATKEAAAKGVAEGKEIAKKKEQAQPVGQTGKHQEVDPAKMSSEDFAKHMNIPHSE